MKNQNKLIKLTVLSMLIALGVVISPLLRFEGMCPMAHFINIVCAVLLGPWYAFICAVSIGIIRMVLMSIPPLALTGAVFGALLSGIFYKASKGKLIFAVLGEIIGTGVIGAILSYPVMTFLWGKEGLSWLFYVPSFICGTLIGGSIAFVFLKKLSNAKLLTKFQETLGSPIYEEKNSILANALYISALGVICFLVTEILTGIFKMSGAFWNYLSYTALISFIVAGLIYYILKKVKN